MSPDVDTTKPSTLPGSIQFAIIWALFMGGDPPALIL